MLPSVLVGFQTLRSNPLRTLLSTLGVIIGVASLVAVLALGDGMEQFARKQIASTTSLQAVVVSPLMGKRIDGVFIPDTIVAQLQVADAAEVRRLAGVQDVAIRVDGSALVVRGTGAPHAAQVAATLVNAQRNQGLRLTAGRWFSEADVTAGARVAVLSDKLARTLGVDASAIGDSLRVQGRSFAIAGIAAAEAGMLGPMLWVPYSVAALAIAPSRAPQAVSLAAIAATVEEVPAVKSRIEAWLAQRHPEWKERVQVRTDEARGLQVKRGILLFKLFMGAITGISLLVGGIGIMNVLLAAVAERTREIGIRKATGARQRDILAQFLSESVAITGLGAFLGFTIGLTGALAITAAMRRIAEVPMYAAFSWSTLLVAAVAAVGVGLAFGMYPALRAARMAPVEAIHVE